MAILKKAYNKPFNSGHGGRIAKRLDKRKQEQIKKEIEFSEMIAGLDNDRMYMYPDSLFGNAFVSGAAIKALCSVKNI